MAEVVVKFSFRFLYFFSVLGLMTTYISLGPGFSFVTHAIAPIDSSTYPFVADSTEIEFDSYKISNSSGVITSAPKVVTCEILPDHLSAGYKHCEAVFVFDDLRDYSSVLSNPSFHILFEESGAKNVHISFSDSYSNARSSFFDSLLTGHSVFAVSGDSSSLSYGSKNFEDFSSSHDISVTVFEAGEEVSSSLDSSRSTYEPSSLITGFFASEADHDIDTSELFAIKVSFEIPEYESNSFSIGLYDSFFSAQIDPPVSACGVLATENSTYTLSSNLTSTGTCLYIHEDNIVLDCNGSTITYSNSSQGYGVYANGTNVTVQGCTFVHGNSSITSSYAAYFDDTQDSYILNNTFVINGTDLYAGYFSSGYNNTFSNNTVAMSGSGSSGVYIDSSNSFASNNTITLYNGSDYAVYVTSGGEDINVTGNVLRSYSENSSLVYSDEALTINVISNNFSCFYSGCSGVELSSGIDSTITSNFFWLSNVSSHALNFVGARRNTVSLNTFNSSLVSNIVYLIDSSRENTFLRNTFNASSSVVNSFFILNSNNNSFDSNVLPVPVTGSYAYYVNSSNYTEMDNETITVSSDATNGILILESSDVMLLRSTISLSGVESTAVNISDSQVNASYNTLIFDSVVEEGTGNIGFSIVNSSESWFAFNTINSSTDYSSLFVLNRSYQNYFRNNTLTIPSTATNGFKIGEWSYSNNFYGDSITISVSGSHAYYFGGNSNRSVFNETNVLISQINSHVNSISDNVFLEVYSSNISTPSSSSFDLTLGDGVSSGNYTFIDTHLDLTSWPEGADGYMNQSWYLDLYVNYTNGSHASSATVLVYDNASSLILNTTTGSNGRIKRTILTEYLRSISGASVLYYNYSVNVSANGQSDSAVFNLTESRSLIFSLFSPSSGSSGSGSSSGSSGGGGSSGSSSSSSCVPDWECNPWSSCTSGTQTRTCINHNSDCSSGKPTLSRSCEPGSEIRETLFDIQLELLSGRVPLLSNISAKIFLLNIGRPGGVNATVDYNITNAHGEIVYSTREIVYVETQIEFIEEFATSNLPEGKYIVRADLYYDGQLEPAHTEQVFYIGEWLSSDVIFSVIVGSGGAVVVVFVSLRVIRGVRFRRRFVSDLKQLEEQAAMKDLSGIEEEYNHLKEDYHKLSSRQKKKLYPRLAAVFSEFE